MTIAGTNSSGASTYKNTYDEYGQPGTSNQGRFQYTGQMWLEEAGVYHYKARIYHAELGRFLQSDPIGYGDGMNMYGYVGGDPVNATDPTGLFCIASRLTGCDKQTTGSNAPGSTSAASGAGSGSGNNNAHSQVENVDFSNFSGVRNPITGVSSDGRVGNHAQAGIISVVRLPGQYQYVYETVLEAVIIAASLIAQLTDADSNNPIEYHVDILSRGQGADTRYAYSSAVTIHHYGEVTISALAYLWGRHWDSGNFAAGLHSHPTNPVPRTQYGPGNDQAGAYITGPNGCVFLLDSRLFYVPQGGC